jgi:hypothetical protein
MALFGGELGEGGNGSDCSPAADAGEMRHGTMLGRATQPSMAGAKRPEPQANRRVRRNMGYALRAMIG